MPYFRSKKTELHLFIPGLLWDQGLPAFELPLLPGLAALIEQGMATPLHAGLEASAIAQSLCVLEGLIPPPSSQPLPLAFWRAIGHGLAVNGHTVCADPAHLHFLREQMVISDVCAQPDWMLSTPQATALLQALEGVFPAPGRLVMGSASHWYLTDLATQGPAGLPLAHVCGHPWQPCADTHTASWAVWMNEIQTVLHAHPENARRTAQGLPAINTLWVWGGAAPPHPNTALPWKRADPKIHVYAQNPLIRGAWQWQGGEARLLPLCAEALFSSPYTDTHSHEYGNPPLMYETVRAERVEARSTALPRNALRQAQGERGAATTLFHAKTGPTPEQWVILDALTAPARHRDTREWERQLMALDQAWFLPLAQWSAQGGSVQLWALSISRKRGFVFQPPKGVARLWRKKQTVSAVVFETGERNGLASR